MGTYHLFRCLNFVADARWVFVRFIANDVGLHPLNSCHHAMAERDSINRAHKIEWHLSKPSCALDKSLLLARSFTSSA